MKLAIGGPRRGPKHAPNGVSVGHATVRAWPAFLSFKLLKSSVTVNWHKSRMKHHVASEAPRGSALTTWTGRLKSALNTLSRGASCRWQRVSCHAGTITVRLCCPALPEACISPHWAESQDKEVMFQSLSMSSLDTLAQLANRALSMRSL